MRKSQKYHANRRGNPTGVRAVFDYRQRAGDSPMAWCMQHQRLITADKALQVLKTAFRVTDAGVFPYATCDGSCVGENEDQS